MIQESTFQFLSTLKKNNNKVWFEEHRNEFARAKLNFEEFVAQVLQKMLVLDAVFAEQIPKDCVYRIYRDVRFSKDKTPYKPYLSAYFSHGGRKWEGAGYYCHVEPGSIFVGGGLWMPATGILKNVRQEIDYNFQEFLDIISGKKFKKAFDRIEGETLQKPPKGYDVTNPAIEYLKMKSFICRCPIPDKSLLTKSASNMVFETFQTLAPLVNFLNRAID